MHIRAALWKKLLIDKLLEDLARAAACVSRRAMIPNQHIQAFVHDVARQHGVSYENTDLDRWAESATNRSGDAVVLDRTEELIADQDDAIEL